MNKIAQVTVLVKLSRYMNNPNVHPETKKVVMYLAKQANMFDGIADTASNAFSGASDMFGSAMSGASNIASQAMTGLSNFASDALSGLGSTTAEEGVRLVKGMDTELSGIVTQLEQAGYTAADIMKAVSSGVAEAGSTMKDFLGSLKQSMFG